MSERTENQIKEAEEIPQGCSLLRISYRIDARAQRDISKRARIGSLIALFAGISILIAFIVLSVLVEESVWLDTVFHVAILLLGAFLFGLGLIFYLSVRKNIKNAERLDALNHYDFYENYMEIESDRRGENIGKVKVYYPDFVKIREKGKFFMLYPTAATVYPVPKEGLSEDEIASLRRVFHLKTRKK